MELVELKISDKENAVKYVLRVKDEEVGYGYIFNREVNPIEVYVGKDYQSNGYGKFIFNSLLNVLRGKNLKGIIFEVDAGNFRFINIVKQAGALELGRFPKVKLALKL